METADTGARQSGHSSANTSTTFANHNNTNKHITGPELQQQSHPAPYPPQRDPLERPTPHDQPAMAAASVLAPNSQYHSQSAYPSSYAPPAPAPSISNMISSTEPRRSTDDEPPPRQSLPSISEVISGTQPAQFHPPPHHPMQSGSSLPSPFAPVSRPFSEADKHSSPQSLHPASSFPPRQDTLPAFTDSPRSVPFSGRPNLPPVPDRRATPPSNPDGPPHHAHEPPRPSDPHMLNGAYPHPHQPQHPPLPQPQHLAMSLHGSQLPPGQMPLPAYPVSPRHAAPSHGPGHYDPRGPPPGHPEDPEYPVVRQRYDNHFENWNYQESLSRIASASRTIFNFAEAYGRLAQEQHGPPTSERLPTEGEVGDMVSNTELLRRSLEEVRDMLVFTIQQERAREGAKIKGHYEDDQDVAMYGGGMKNQYAMTEVKKRRGRAAPPGRCHSCNRIDTPEWRRGPDGARTLCNACGLHYAKLERKRQLEARAIRPKPEDRN